MDERRTTADGNRGRSASTSASGDAVSHGGESASAGNYHIRAGFRYARAASSKSDVGGCTRCRRASVGVYGLLQRVKGKETAC